MKFAVTLSEDEGGVIVASCPALPGCHSQGKGREEALVNITEAITAYVESMMKHGEPLPSHSEIVEVEAPVKRRADSSQGLARG